MNHTSPLKMFVSDPATVFRNSVINDCIQHKYKRSLIQHNNNIFRIIIDSVIVKEKKLVSCMGSVSQLYYKHESSESKTLTWN